VSPFNRWHWYINQPNLSGLIGLNKLFHVSCIILLNLASIIYPSFLYCAANVSLRFHLLKFISPLLSLLSKILPQPIQLIKLIKLIKPIKLIQLIKLIKPIKLIQLIKPTQPIKLTQLTFLIQIGNKIIHLLPHYVSLLLDLFHFLFIYIILV